MNASDNANPWDDLVADLGLSPEKPQTSSEPAVEPPAESAAPPVAETVPEEPLPIPEESAPPRGRRRRTPAVAAEVDVAPPAAEPEAPAAVPETMERVDAAVIEEAPEGETAPAEASSGEAGEDKPRGRSRRRRRGRGSKSAPAASAVPTEGEAETPVLEEATPVAEVEEVAPPTPPEVRPQEEQGERSRGRRGRGRRPERDEGPRAGAQEIEETPVEIEGEEPESVAGDEEVDDLSNWNVPTWAELIGSLYRPDR